MDDTVTASAAGPRRGDLARRLTLRREQLGLSLEEVARRTGMSPTYLDYFEHSADVDMNSITWLRLADALDISAQALAGGDVERPAGIGRAGPHPVLQSLTRPQCEAHLQSGGVGRVVSMTPRGPSAYPVNFAFVDGHIVFRTKAAAAAALRASGMVGFEVDQIDQAMSEGWSVLVTGAARLVEDADEITARQVLDIEPWAGGERPALVRIMAHETSGRAIHQRAVPPAS
jgi:prepilin-type processing-associated H-X9-DG protein